MNLDTGETIKLVGAIAVGIAATVAWLDKRDKLSRADLEARMTTLEAKMEAIINGQRAARLEMEGALFLAGQKGEAEIANHITKALGLLV